ncbi:MAG: methyltransferase domain-containing protein [Bryobacteraceae bacterium]|nr:methyltransferase domain-containing protein [Bryobacteraceae bacterium]
MPALEFTGERVVPGEVDTDLWNEHFSRYLFAARLARSKRVADLGCGAGYGTAELAKTAVSVAGIDRSEEAVAFARERYGGGNVEFHIADCADTGLPSASVDLAVAFELVEHLDDARALLREAARLLAPGGQLAISTPNRDYYNESRRGSGPNPFHRREYSLAEFRDLLGEYFPQVTLFAQNHASAIVIEPLLASGSQAALRAEAHADPGSAHFYIAVCAVTPQIGAPTFVYLPSAANVLRERERHIARLDEEIRLKTAALEDALARHAAQVAAYRRLEGELASSNDWAAQRDAEYREKVRHVEALENQLAEERGRAAAHTAKLDEQIAEWERYALAKDVELAAARQNSASLAVELEGKVVELGGAVELLHQSEAELEARTNWALSLDRELAAVRERLHAATASRWLRLGRTLHLGPNLES